MKTRYTVQIFGMLVGKRTIEAAHTFLSVRARQYGAGADHTGIRDNRTGEWLTADQIRAALAVSR